MKTIEVHIIIGKDGTYATGADYDDAIGNYQDNVAEDLTSGRHVVVNLQVPDIKPTTVTVALPDIPDNILATVE